LILGKSTWEGNHWPSVEFDQYEYEYSDFLIVLTQVCEAFTVEIPEIVGTLDGYNSEIAIDGQRVVVLIDNWTFSLATPTTTLRDKIFDALEPLRDRRIA
jgi:hypothetical protein